MSRSRNAAVNSPPPGLRVLTFNILYDDVRTLAPPWRSRRALVVAAIRSSEAAVACLQEVSTRQLADLMRDLPDYQFLPGSPSGPLVLPAWGAPLRGIAKFLLGDFFEVGEQCPILIRKDLSLACLDTGTFWLSSPGDASTGPPTPHVVNWARVQVPSGAAVDIYNTHAGLVRGAAASEALRRFLDRRWTGGAQVLAGDLNALPHGRMLRSLTSEEKAGAPGFEDAWATAQSKTGGGATFHWGCGLPGPRLDYVLVRPRCLVSTASVSARRVAGTLPSDHFAVTADLQIGAPPDTRIE
jgi:endonuclease/exonuclease/phosphatase family metal-dependent hydrolase